MKQPIFRNSWLEAFEGLKKRVVSGFGEDGFRLLKESIAKLASYHYNRKSFMLLGEERKLYAFLVENGFNPFTVYRWFLLERIPDDVRFQLRNGHISQKLASRIHFRRRHESRSKVCVDIRIMGLNLVRSM